MYYDYPPSSDEIKQGDIFLDIPRVAFSFSELLSIVEEGKDKPVSISWEEILDKKKNVAAILGVDSVPAIVASQSCDAQSKEHITLCEIVELTEIRAFNNYEGWMSKRRAEQLVEQNRKMPGIFILSPDEQVGFSRRMAVDFSRTIGVYREDLKNFTAKRKGRLKKFACEHFREKLSHFFHRYAWDEWYILSKEELNAHSDYSKLESARLYDHQK